VRLEADGDALRNLTRECPCGEEVRRREEAVLGPMPMQPGEYAMPSQKSSGFVLTEVLPDDGDVTRSRSAERGHVDRRVVRRDHVSHPSRSLSAGIVNGVIRICTAPGGLRR
jgi:hypothetical protein